jgi:rhodanese-related sulfurtransferase
MGLLDFLFGKKIKKLQDFMARDAIILDVRSKAEYDGGAIPGSKHIALQHVADKIEQIKKWDRPIITCCARGVRSASATAILKKNGIEAVNGGGWSALYQKI